jgi:hypothetical protein
MDDLRIYRRALTQSEVAALYNAPDVETFADWAAAHLTPAQQANPALNTPHADADSNGLSNAIEFALGGGFPLPFSVQLLGPPGAQTVRVTLTRNALARGHTLIVETSANLTDWTPLATSINGTPFTGPATISETAGTIRTVTLDTPFSAPAFFRARVLMP